MKEYKYQDEGFWINGSGGCELTVSDRVNTVSITLNRSGPSVYRVETVKGGWWWYTNTIEESADRACRELIEHRTAASTEDACKAIGKFMDNL